MGFRPEGLNTGSRPPVKVPTRVTVMASYGEDPSKLPNEVVITFHPIAREKVDRAVAAFIEIMEGNE